MGYEIKRLDTEAERRTFDHGAVDVAQIGDHKLGRVTLQPGWKWSTSVKPIVKTDLCEVAMAGLDAITFTGGVGEHAPAVRELAADGLGFLGIALNLGRNRAGAEDREIGRQDAPVRAFVVAAREDLEIAREVRRLLS